MICSGSETRVGMTFGAMVFGTPCVLRRDGRLKQPRFRAGLTPMGAGGAFPKVDGLSLNAMAGCCRP